MATCLGAETVGAARGRVATSQWSRCIVLNDAGVVQGVLDESGLSAGDDAIAEVVMRLGPATVRADEDVAGLLRRMGARGTAAVLVTDPDGRLIGVVVADDARDDGVPDSGPGPAP